MRAPMAVLCVCALAAAVAPPVGGGPLMPGVPQGPADNQTGPTGPGGPVGPLPTDPRPQGPVPGPGANQAGPVGPLPTDPKPQGPLPGANQTGPVGPTGPQGPLPGPGANQTGPKPDPKPQGPVPGPGANQTGPVGPLPTDPRPQGPLPGANQTGPTDPKPQGPVPGPGANQTGPVSPPPGTRPTNQTGPQGPLPTDPKPQGPPGSAPTGPGGPVGPTGPPSKPQGPPTPLPPVGAPGPGPSRPPIRTPKPARDTLPPRTPVPSRLTPGPRPTPGPKVIPTRAPRVIPTPAPRVWCTGRVHEWGSDEQEWCCREKHIGCRAPAPYDCAANVSSLLIWPSEKQRYCCKTELVACEALTEKVFDCVWSAETATPWTDVQSEFCCKEQHVRCPDESEVQERSRERVCLEREENGTLSDDPSLMNACCRRFSTGCPSEFDCFDGTDVKSWSETKTVFCCREKDVGCAMRCDRSEEMLSQEQATYCCEQKGLSCPDDWLRDQQQLDATQATEDVNAGMVLRELRLKVSGDAGDVLDNPKQALRRLRWALLWASDVLAGDPRRLVVTVLGVLMVNATVPPPEKLSQWVVTVPRSWNDELHTEEVHRIKTEMGTRTSRSAAALGATTHTDNTGYYIDYDVQDVSPTVVDTAVTQIATTATEAAEGQGVLGTTGSGPELQVLGSGQTDLGVTTAPEGDRAADDEGWTWPLVGALGALCLGSAVTALVVNRKKKETCAADAFHEMYDVDDQADYTVTTQGKPKQTIETGCI